MGISESSQGRPATFATTRWSVVIAAGAKPSADSEKALATLCETYWYPIYAFVRRRGHPSEEAKDLTQEFFARLLEKNSLQVATPDKGRFRSYLLAAVKHFLADKWDYQRAQKRGGGKHVLRLEMDRAEEHYVREPSHDLTPEKIFERRWALTLLERVVEKLRSEYRRTGKAEVFEALKGMLGKGSAETSYAEAAAELKISPGAARVAVHRLRQRYAHVLEQEIAETVADARDIKHELKHLFEALAN
ncbi:MAG TPA: sigma-70 family RNA polymerase sigma factor [Planctomycetota bacterium]|nr:sigma-70 family RNA polymerase sigma factor [Planctomycetota bacterium]